MVVDFSKEETMLIEEMLTKELHNLPVEIHHTFSRAFKEHLKEKQKKIENLVRRIESVK